MTVPTVLEAVVQAAVGATGAARGWIVVPTDGHLRVVAAGGERPGDALGAVVPAGAGSAAFVVESGQSLAFAARARDPRVTAGVAAALGRPPTSVLCVPCVAGDEILGALEVVDSSAGTFTVDDVEAVTMLGGIGGAALAERDDGPAAVPDPAELSAEIAGLAADDPARYALVATVLRDLLARG